MPQQKRRHIEWGLILGFWTLFAVLIAGSRLVGPDDGITFGPELARRVGRVFLTSYLWAALTPLIFWIAERFELERARLGRHLLLHLAVAGAVAIFMDLSGDAVRAFVLPSPDDPSQFHPMRAIVRFWFLNELIMYAAVLAVGVARVYYWRHHERREEAQQLKAETARLEAQLTHARLEALRMQLNPHFLFNTLHAISTLVGRDPQGVRRIIARLSGLLRYVLEEDDAQEVPLEDDVQFLRDYLEIQQIRFQGRLDVSMDIAPRTQHALVPTLLLQPIVENAIKHGASQAAGGGRVALHSERQGQRLVLHVDDNGPGITGEEALQGGVGLKNVRERLSGLYGDDATIAFSDSPLGGLRVTVAWPFRDAVPPAHHRSSASQLASTP
ncbi:sensor histidine kinase [Salisaeta longa]|uniref:sensor histidine kinase n=1 Tax=Salisaeta longa TaxID=503170 RepID=UPI00146DD058|nr:histidine kinase [Salisaeta longa]